MATEFANELRSICSKIENYSSNAPPMEELKRLKELSSLAKQKDLESLQEEMFLKVLPFLTHSLLTNRKFGGPQELDLAGEFISNIQLMLNTYCHEPRYLEALRNTVELDKPLYTQYLQDENNYSVPPFPLEDPHREWRASLAQGENIDAVKVDMEYDRKCWARANVALIDEEDYLYLEFEEEGTEFDRKVPRQSCEIAPFKSKSGDDSWREGLESGSFVDVFDTFSTWYNSTIIGKRKRMNDHGTYTTEVNIAYRIYEPSGEKIDEHGSYRGWSSRYDEWMSARSPRIAPYNLTARRWPIPLVNSLEEPIIDDSNDFVEKSEYAYCVLRPKKSSSALLVRNLNRFGQENLFDLIIQKLNDRENWTDFQQAFSMIYFAGKIYPLYHKRFAMSYIPSLTKAVQSYLIEAPSGITREFSREQIEQTLLFLEGLLKRLYTIQEKNRVLEEFNLKLSLKLFKTPYLDRRIQGLKGIIDTVKNAKFSQYKPGKSEELAQWIKDNQILEDIFGSSAHYQLIQRAGELIRNQANENMLSTEIIEEIWKASEKNDEDMSGAVYKVLSEVSTSLKAEHIEAIVQLIRKIPKLTTEHVDLLYELTKYPLRAGNATSWACDMLWEVALSQGPHSGRVLDLALDHFCSLMRSWDLRRNRFSVILQCVEKLRENTSAIQAIQIIKKILSNFALNATATEPMSRSAVVEELVKEHSILTAFFDNLKYFKEKASEAKATEETVICDRTPYKDQVEERLDFLHVLLTSSYTLTLSRNQMDSLWELFMEKAQCSAEKQIFMKWLGEVTQSQSQGKKIFDDTEVHIFFTQKVANLDNDFSGISQEAFVVFKSFFLLVNVSMNKMKQILKSTYPISGGYTHSYNYPDTVKEFEYQIVTPPANLEGIECLKKIIMRVNHPDVLLEAIEFINDLYDNLSTEEDLSDIREEFIKFCLDFLNEGTTEQQKRALSLLKTFMEECEKQGTGGLRSHSALLKGDVHNVNVINHITYHPYNSDIPKKLEFKVYSNTTIWELRCMIGKKVKCLSDQFRILRTFSQKEIKDSDNGKTLSEIRMRANESLTVYRRYVNLPRAPLLTADNELTPTTLRIFTSWFYKFADKGELMTPEGCAAFTNSCTGDQCKATDKRIQDFFTAHDTDKDGYLTLRNFLDFYKEACINRPNVVWTNLSAHHYRNDLGRFDDDQDQDIDVTTLPGYILTRHQKNFDLLFEALNNSELADQAWSLIIKLPTNPQIMQEVKELDQENWNRVINPESNHRLLYTLQIIESFMEDPSEENQEEFEQRRQWKLNFIKLGGFQHIYSILLNFTYSNDIFQKNCIGFILKLISMFVLAAFTALRPEIYEVVELVRKQSGGFEEEEKSEEKTETDKKEESPKYNETKGFKQLIEDVMLEGLGEQMVNSIDFENLIQRLIKLMAETLNQEDCEPEDKHIIDSALELWVSCLLHRNELMQVVYNYSDQINVTEFAMRGLTYQKSIQIRKAFSQSLQSICKKVVYPQQMPTPFFLRELIEKMPRSTLQKGEYSQFFEILRDLVEKDVEDPSLDYAELARDLLQLIQIREFKEKRNSFDSDKVLVGQLSLLETVLRCVPELKDLASSWVHQMFVDLLFPPPQNYDSVVYDSKHMEESHYCPPKAKSRETRNSAYNLLATLAHNHRGNLESILELLISLKSQIFPVKSWSYAPATEARSSSGYAGIINLGCVCYMHSMLQQFYMIPQFRYCILDVDDKKPPTNLAYLEGDSSVDPTETGVDVDDNMLHQLQYLFGYLELTDRNAYNPSHFCYSFKDFTGRPTNISIQQDAQEFLNMIFDRLEQSIKETPYKYIMKDIFGGTTVSQIKCNECSTVKENYEDFYNLSVDVKHSSTLYESLSRFISGDSISDFHCDHCEKKVDITRRTLLSTLPNILIVHLQRIVFNFDTFANEKINSRLEFPHELNLFDYTKDATDQQEHNKEEYEYELVGVVVQSGFAQMGHYYSFIRNRRPDGSLDPQKWLEFNDSIVRSFK